MARGINKVIIVGNVGQDPETRTFSNGGSVTNISVATSEAWRDKQTGQMQERTEWHRIALMDRGNFKLGQIAAQYLKKGSKVYIEGSLRTRKWQDQQGNDRYSTEIMANEMQMLDSRNDQPNAEGFQPQANNFQQPPQQAAPQSAPQQSAPQQSSQQPAPAAPSGFDDFDEDIPF